MKDTTMRQIDQLFERYNSYSYRPRVYDSRPVRKLHLDSQEFVELVIAVSRIKQTFETGYCVDASFNDICNKLSSFIIKYRNDVEITNDTLDSAQELTRVVIEALKLIRTEQKRIHYEWPLKHMNVTVVDD